MKSKMCRALSIAISVALVSTLASSVKPYEVKAEEKKTQLSLKEQLLKNDNAELKKNNSISAKQKNKLGVKDSSMENEQDPNETVRVIVELTADSAAEKSGNAAKASKAVIDNVIDNQANVKKKVESIADNKVKNTFGNVLNGFSINVKRKDIAKIKKLDGVKKVSEVKQYYPEMTTAKDLTQIKSVWKNLKYKGEGLVAAIIDTGIDYTHKDFKTPSDKSKLKIKKKDYDTGKYFTDKIPYGYNFADKNNEVVDKSGVLSMHGMHVAGIVGADGSEDEVNRGEAIQGVAPEAQLLAMKVFSNNPDNKSAYSDDIVAAIEKSVEVGADVINMSLGSPCGFVDSDDPEQKAIKKASDAGVVCVLSAGNEYNSTYPYLLNNQKDTGVVGSAGVAPDALQVASCENTDMIMNAFQANLNGKTKNMGFTKCNVDPDEVFKSGQKLSVVYCGYGQESDFAGKDVKGKVALINPAKIPFTDMQNNAEKAGAAAAVIYHPYSDSYMHMASASTLKIPALFIGKTDGEALLKAENPTIEFGHKTTSNPNAAAKQMSSFTSWGPAPNLDFAPEVTAPGGNIYSTANNNGYQNMSGTSMAAPHTTGATALVLQSVKEKKLGLSGKDLVNYAKNSLINTTQILYDKEDSKENLPYSPRRQGAGLIQVEDAIKNNVLALADDGQATVSLKEVGKNTSFDITLRNYGDKNETYTLQNPGGVLTSYVPTNLERKMSYDTNLKGAQIEFKDKEVTVPAKSTKKVTVTLNIDDKSEKENYAEGYIQFKNKAEDPSLVVPFMGYYGNWSKEKVVSPMVWDDESKDYAYASYASVKVSGRDDMPAGIDGLDENGYTKINKEKVAISPNGDGYYDELIPSLFMLRNAKTMSVDVLDKDKKVIAQNIKKDKDVTKDLFAKVNDAQERENLKWDGKAYNSQSGENEVVPDGQYYMNIKSKIDMQNAEEQTVEVPVKIDTKAPVITFGSDKHSDSDKYDLKFALDDATSGVKNYLVYVNGSQVKPSTKDNKNYECTVSLDDDTKDNKIEIAASDNALNIADETFEVSTLKDTAPVMFDNFATNTNYSKKNVTVTGRVSAKTKTLKIAGNDVAIKADRTFEAEVKLNEGVNAVSVYASDKDGNELANYGIKVFCDVTAPVITLNTPSVSDGVINASSHKVELKGTVSDNFQGYEFYINGEEVIKYENDVHFGPETNTKEFTKELAVNDGDVISLKAVDLFGNKTVNKYTVKINPSLGVSVQNVADGAYYNKDVVPDVKYNADLYDVTMTVNDQPYKNGQALSDEGKYTLVVKSVLKGEDKPEGVQKYQFTIDKTAPVVKINNVENGKAYNKDVLPNVEVEEGSVVTSITLDGKDYDKADITAEGKHKLSVKAVDKAGNETVVEKEFTIDKTAPEVTVSGVFDGLEYNKKVIPVVTVNEETSKLDVTLDGKAYDGSAVTTEGKHVLKVTAVDLAGNTSEKTVTFTVKMPKPADQPANPSKDPGNSQNKPGTGNTASSINGDAEKPADTNKAAGAVNTVSKTESVSKMPKTGSMVNTTSILVVSMLLVILGSGIVVLKKKKTSRL